MWVLLKECIFFEMIVWIMLGRVLFMVDFSMVWIIVFCIMV